VASHVFSNYAYNGADLIHQRYRRTSCNPNTALMGAMHSSSKKGGKVHEETV